VLKHINQPFADVAVNLFGYLLVVGRNVHPMAKMLHLSVLNYCGNFGTDFQQIEKFLEVQIND
jgi:hypothetical protein